MADWTLRDEIEMRALVAVVQNSADWHVTQADGVEKPIGTIELYAACAYQFADAMIAAREPSEPAPEAKAEVRDAA